MPMKTIYKWFTSQTPLTTPTFPPSYYTFRRLTLSSVRLSGDVGGMEEGEAMGVGMGEGEGEGVWCRRVEAGTLVRRSNFFEEAARTEKGEPVVTHHNMGRPLRKQYDCDWMVTGL